MIIDTSFFEPLYQAEKKKTYKELIDYLVSLNFDESFYKKMGIYYESHYFNHKELFVPLSINFLLNFYYGIEKKDYRFITKAKNILSKPIASSIKYVFSRELQICDCFLSHQVLITYEDKYGKQRAEQIKKKISISMRNLDKNIILNRNKSIQNYASNRPETHNKSISLSKKKKIIDLKTKKIYSCIEEAIIETKLCKTYIRQICQGKRKLPNYNLCYLSKYESFIQDLL